MSYKAETFMGIMRWKLYDTLKSRYSNVELTYGYITKNIRIRNNLKKLIVLMQDVLVIIH